jgi:exonuclease III
LPKHITNTDTLKYQWKGEIVQTPGSSNSRGVAILYNKAQFDEIISTRKDNEGRFCGFTASKNGILTCFMNIYAPNNHYDSLKFFQMLEELMFREMDRNSTTNFVISGDFNIVFESDVNLIGRKSSQQEKKVVNYVKNIMTKFNIIESYRALHSWGGFTWGRNNPSYLRSRLDHVLMSATFKAN